MSRPIPQRFAGPQGEETGEARSPASKPAVAPVTTKESGLSLNGLISALASVALVLAAVLFALWWQGMTALHGGREEASAEGLSAANSPASTGSAQPERNASALEVALSSPDRIDANAGDVVEFPIAIDATAALPARSIIVITALPQGASFSEGRPYGVTSWSLRPDEIAGLRLRLPEQSGASDMRLKLVAGDGGVLSQSETRVSIAPSPAEVATTGAIGSSPPEQTARAEHTGSVAGSPPATQPKPASSTANEPAVKVNTVKVMTIKPPSETRPHDGAYALGEAPAEPQAHAEWMETKSAVDMHAKAWQSSETVNVAQKGIKVRVTARDKNWIEVTDPATSTTGWIYNRFLEPADPPSE